MPAIARAAQRNGAKVLGGSLKVGSTNSHGNDVSNPYGPAVITFALAEPDGLSGTVDISVDTTSVQRVMTLSFTL